MPWYRVVSSTGAISSRGPGTDGAGRQKDELEAEGIEVLAVRGTQGDWRVDLRTWGWFPEVGSVDLPEREEDEEEDAGTEE